MGPIRHRRPAAPRLLRRHRAIPLRPARRLSFARIAEYQKRAAVHVHAVVRLDSPDGPTDEPPPWGTLERLTRAVHASAQRVTVRTPYSPAVGELELSWGTQTDVRVLHADGDGPDDDAVAAYVAK